MKHRFIHQLIIDFLLIVVVGYLPAASTFTLTPGLEDTPVLHCHGIDDPVVCFAF